MLDRNDRLALPGAAGALASPHATQWGGYPPFEDEPADAFNPVKLFWIAYRYRWLIGVTVMVALVLGTVTTLMQAPKYAATARIEIMVPTARILQDMDVVAQTNDLRTFETAREKLRSRDLARRIALELNLVNDATFLFPRPDFSFGNVLSRVFGTPAAPSLDDYELPEREAIAIDQLLRSLSVTLLRGTSLLEVRYASHDPQQASRIANQVVRSYMDQQVDRTIETSDLARQFIDEKVAETKTQLERSEAALVAYTKDQQLAGAGEDGALITASITAINDALAKAVQNRLEHDRLVSQIDAGAAAQLKQVLDSDVVGSTRTKLTELRAEYNRKLSTFKPDFPEMRDLAAQISGFERQLESEVSAISNSIRLTHQGYVQEELDLRQKLAELEADQVAFRDKNIQYTILKREVESNRAQYESLIAKQNELGVVGDLRRANIDIVDLSVPPKGPFEPSLPRNLLLFFGAALALSAAAIYILELLNNKFNAPEQVESELKLPLLGIVPKVDSETLGEALADTRSNISEAYRSLRTALQFAAVDGTPRSLLVTSAAPAESKSTSAYKLAEEFAAIGNKVLLIDCDLRRPSLHRVFKVDNTVGLTNLLTNTVGHEDIQNLFHRSADQPNLAFLATGPMTPNPADMLSSPRMASILHACSKAYDLIIIDGPPVLGLADALILSRLSTATLLVVAAHQTARRATQGALKRLHQAGANVVGALLSKLDVERIEYSYSYRYMYEGYYAYGAEGSPGQIAKGDADEPANAAQGVARTVGDLYRRHLRPLLGRG